MPDLLPVLTAAVTDLWLPSETDAPITVVTWDSAVTPESLRSAAGLPADAPVVFRDPATLFTRLTTPQDWHPPAEQARVRRFQALWTLLQTALTDLTLVRIGTNPITVFVLGRAADGSTIGIQSHVVET